MGQYQSISKEEVEEYKLQFRKTVHNHHTNLLLEFKKQLDYEREKYIQHIHNYYKSEVTNIP